MSAQELLEAACTTLAERLADPLRWEWDARFSAALVVIKDAQKEAALSALDAVFSARFDPTTIADASSATQDLITTWGGLRTGQHLSTLRADEALLAAVWWPWGGGTTFSLRVTVVGLDGDALLKRAFGLLE